MGCNIFYGNFLKSIKIYSSYKYRRNKDINMQVRYVKLSYYHYAEAKRERRYSSYSFLTSALDGGQWSASCPGRASPLGKDPQYPLDRRLGGPHSWSDTRGSKKNPLPLPGIET
jgi:hypothetical protein